MCGINGFTFSAPDALRRMHRATRHRGPDDEGFYETPQIALAHNRLSVIDLSPAGKQPMSTPDGRFTIVFNGEIYNYLELRAALEKIGARFRSQSDTEVLLQAFAAWGEDLLPKLNGIFAFAVWDRNTETLTLARDPVGVKPLVYATDGRRLIFSSEIKGILAHGVSREIDPDAMNLFFRFLYVPSPRTMLRGIWKLPPGSVLRWQAGEETRVRRWWRVQEGEYLHDRREATHALRGLLQDAVDAQLVSDRPLGVFLSGGIDSTAILGLMRRTVTGPIKTFSVGYEQTEEQEKYNADFVLAVRTAKYFGAEHHPIVLSGRDVAASFEEIVWHMDEPVSNHIQPATYLLAKYAKPEITVALGGDGGDELFGGYDRYWYSAWLDRIRALPAPMRRSSLLHLAGRLTGRASFLDKAALPFGVDRFLSFMQQKEDRVSEYLRAEVNHPEAVREVFAPFFMDVWNDSTNQWMAVDLQTWLPDESLARTDKLTMAHGLEERVPLLDPRLVAFALRTPSRWKLDRRTLGKKILRDALADLLPPFIVKEKKRGFFSPAAKWLRGDLQPFIREVLSDGYLGGDDVIDLPAARRMLDDHIAKRRYGLNQLWAIMTWRVWRRWIDKGVKVR